MCCSYGSVTNATSVCPACQVFSTKPTNGRCPHVTAICRNRTNHPRMDVVFLKNSEVDCFNGCGYCKWITKNPTVSPNQNPGWPGCCRPPVGQHECALIQAADWQYVSQLHHVPIPPDVKAVLPLFASKSMGAGSGKNSAEQPNPPPFDRRNSVGSLSKQTSPKASSTPTIGRSRQGSVLGPAPPLSLTNPASPPDQTPPSRRQTDSGDKRNEAPQSSAHSSPSAKAKDLDTFTPRRKSSARPPITKSPVIEPATVRRSSSSSNSPPGSKASAVVNRSAIIAGTPRTPPKKFIPPANAVPSSASSSSGSSDSLGSATDGTMTSDGGFTDYLSEESEAELQRQAEAKAALVAQTQLEEMEFKAARQQLATVDLRPPKSWTSSVNGRAAAAHFSHPSNPAFSAAPVMAHTGSSARG